MVSSSKAPVSWPEPTACPTAAESKRTMARLGPEALMRMMLSSPKLLLGEPFFK